MELPLLVDVQRYYHQPIGRFPTFLLGTQILADAETPQWLIRYASSFSLKMCKGMAVGPSASPGIPVRHILSCGPCNSTNNIPICSIEVLWNIWARRWGRVWSLARWSILGIPTGQRNCDLKVFAIWESINRRAMARHTLAVVIPTTNHPKQHRIVVNYRNWPRYGLRWSGWYCNPAQHELCRPLRGRLRPAQPVLCRIAVPTTTAQTV